MSAIAVVHLVRKDNGLDPLLAFIRSYREHPAGIDHDLIVVFKGFLKGETLDHERVLSPTLFRSMHYPDKGFDIEPYFASIRYFEHRYFAFLNSFSVIRCDDWLAKMHEHAAKSAIGAVSSSGSWESIYSGLRAKKKKPFSIRRRLKLAFARRRFSEFPNYHLRTNAFMASREILLKIRVPKIRNKMDAFRFESGFDGFTNQIFQMNKLVLVVGCDGRAYAKEDWAGSGTFRSRNQENLLVQDNKTEDYMTADSDLRAQLSELAWGKPGSHAPGLLPLVERPG